MLKLLATLALLSLVACGSPSSVPTSPTGTPSPTLDAEVASVEDELRQIIDGMRQATTPPISDFPTPAPGWERLAMRVERLEQKIEALEQGMNERGDGERKRETPESQADWHKRMSQLSGDANIFNWSRNSDSFYYGHGGGGIAPLVTMEPLNIWRDRMDERVTALEWHALGGPRQGPYRPPYEHLHCPGEVGRPITSQCDRRPLWLETGVPRHDHQYVPSHQHDSYDGSVRPYP